MKREATFAHLLLVVLSLALVPSAAIGSPAQTFTTLVSFNKSNGADPYLGHLVQGLDGNFYGTTSKGGTDSSGTVFKITPSGTLTTLYSFCAQTNCTDGAGPLGGAVQATNGSFYGTTAQGGSSINCNGGCGTVFEITQTGTLTTLHSFAGTDGSIPEEGVVQATNGNFYGTTAFGGSSDNCFEGCGTVFGLSVGLGSFVETLPTSGKVGAKVIILGNNLTGTTSVTFNGTAATFTVVKSTEIITTVPTGATTGTVKVTTPRKTLKSNVTFRVKA
jgi:uncharacterized repeat protein (TIGR03803 family)